MPEFVTNTWRAVAEILIIAFALYQIYRAFRATRGAQILMGAAIVLVTLVLVSQVANFKVIEFLITRAAPLMAVALVVVFQPELRDALARLGSRGILRFTNTQRMAFIERVADAVVSLSKKRVGALIAIERGISLKKYL
ncbi:MAG: TIGR00159 family protein, partial [Akkermansiaceae bacterium]|nr:TIGR00159 family protein [Akkermansiaceae bacterium]